MQATCQVCGYDLDEGKHGAYLNMERIFNGFESLPTTIRDSFSNIARTSDSDYRAEASARSST
jgi:hypothetical protein